MREGTALHFAEGLLRRRNLNAIPDWSKAHRWVLAVRIQGLDFCEGGDEFKPAKASKIAFCTAG